MSEKPESDEFDEDDVEESSEGNERVDVDRAIRDLDQARKRGQKLGDPAWRRLERLLEEKRTADLMSDFDDYDIRGPEDSDNPPAKAGKGRARKAR